MHDSSHPCVCWWHQPIPVGDWCIKRWIGGSVVTEADRWVVLPHYLWQQSPDASWEKLSLHETRVSGIKVGNYRALQRVPALQAFVVWMDNNLLMYIMSTPNLDATGNQWVGALAQFNFELEYQKGHDNTVVDILSQVTIWLDPETVKSILQWSHHGNVASGLKSMNWAMVEGMTNAWNKKVCVTAGHPIGRDTCYWLPLKSQREGPDDEHSVGLAEGPEADGSEDASGGTCLQRRRQTDLMELTEFYAIHQEALVPMLNAKSCQTEDPLLFVVPQAHCVATLYGCHWDTGHQGCDHTLSLLLRMLLMARNELTRCRSPSKFCMCYLQHEGNLSKAPLHLIVSTVPMDLLHVDFISIEMTMQLNKFPKVLNILVFQDHFTKHIMAYVHDPWLGRKDCCQIFVPGLHINLSNSWPGS